MKTSWQYFRINTQAALISRLISRMSSSSSYLTRPRCWNSTVCGTSVSVLRSPMMPEVGGGRALSVGFFPAPASAESLSSSPSLPPGSLHMRTSGDMYYPHQSFGRSRHEAGVVSEQPFPNRLQFLFLRYLCPRACDDLLEVYQMPEDDVISSRPYRIATTSRRRELWHEGRNGIRYY